MCGTALVLSAVASVARAGDVIVVESHIGTRIEDAEFLLAPLIEELGADGRVQANPVTVGALIERRMSLPGLPLTEREDARAEQLVARGWNHWIDGGLEPALSDLESALDLYRQAPATIAIDQSRRLLMEKALVGTALAYRRLGQRTRSTAAMAARNRMFPDSPIDKMVYGPEAVSIYKDVLNSLSVAESATLRIEVDDPDTSIFISGRFVSIGSTEQTLAPGLYRVFTRRGKMSGRAHLVELGPGQDHALSIEWGLESSLRTSKWAGFEFADEATRADNEAAYAVQVARATGASSVIVVGIRNQGRARMLIGTIYSLDSATPLRSATLAAATVPTAAQVQSLARFLTAGETSPDIDVLVGTPVAGKSSGAALWTWMSIGAGVVAVGVGSYLIGVDGDGDCELSPGQKQCAQVWDTKMLGIATIGAGVVSIGVGAYLWRRGGGDDASDLQVSLVPTDGGAIGAVAGRF